MTINLAVTPAAVVPVKVCPVAAKPVMVMVSVMPAPATVMLPVPAAIVNALPVASADVILSVPELPVAVMVARATSPVMA